MLFPYCIGAAEVLIVRHCVQRWRPEIICHVLRLFKKGEIARQIGGCCTSSPPPKKIRTGRFIRKHEPNLEGLASNVSGLVGAVLQHLGLGGVLTVSCVATLLPISARVEPLNTPLK